MAEKADNKEFAVGKDDNLRGRFATRGATPNVALWGKLAAETQACVLSYVNSPGLDDFLKLCWR